MFCLENRRVSKRPRYSGRKVSLDGVLLLARKLWRRLSMRRRRRTLPYFFLGGDRLSEWTSKEKLRLHSELRPNTPTYLINHPILTTCRNSYSSLLCARRLSRIRYTTNDDATSHP